MRMITYENGEPRQISEMSYVQGRQAMAIMDCIGRLIPQEGVDYDVSIIFKGDNDSDVSMSIQPHTDKGEWWKKYVMEMIPKYRPTVENPEQSLPEDPDDKAFS